MTNATSTPTTKTRAPASTHMATNRIRAGWGGLFQISDRRYVIVRKLKGSPCWMATECYPCADAPTGWYSGTDHQYVQASGELDAANAFSSLCQEGKVRLLEL
ncbi:hypothetical protein LCGC14_2503580 [marine sediment metagenome]|uniref:Uncharacterized protein n=1 Tax=marine sediment metagenome TaxID=412755 RepID=A0A0F9DUU6_9ZZZZ